VGWAIIVGRTKRQFQTTNLLKVNSKLNLTILQVAMFQNVLMDPKILKEKQISLFLSMSFGIFVFFQFHTQFTCDFTQM
jgi:hypothetical protein